MSKAKCDTLDSAPMLRRASKLCYVLASWIIVSGVCTVLIILSPQFTQYGATLLLPAAAFFFEIGLLLCFPLGLCLSKVGEELGVTQIRKVVLVATAPIGTFSAAFALFLLSSFYGSLSAVSGYILLLLVVCLFATLILGLPASLLLTKGMSEVTRRIGLGKIKSYRRSRTIGQSFIFGAIAYSLLIFVLNSFNMSYKSFPAMVALLFAITLFELIPAQLIMEGLAYGNPDAATLLPEPLPKNDRGAVAQRFAELPKLVMQEFEKIEPDKTFETKRFKIMVKGDIYILVPRFYRPITRYPLFIRFFRKTAISEKRLAVPYGLSMRKMHFSHTVAGFPVTKARGNFSIPVDVSAAVGGKPKEVYAKGPCIAYIVDGYGGVLPSPLSSVMPPLLDRNAILEIISELSNESIP
nr:hypothetical protein [Candidatus Njordarchaeota archaeon]